VLTPAPEKQRRAMAELLCPNPVNPVHPVKKLLSQDVLFVLRLFAVKKSLLVRSSG